MSESNEVPKVAETAEIPAVRSVPKPPSYSKRLKKMSNNQLRGEMRRVLREEKGAAGLTAAITAACLIVFNGTSETNPKARLGAYPR